MTEVARIEPRENLPAQSADAFAMVSMIERVVLDPTASLDKLERMLAMKERLDAQQSRKAFDLAISEAKAEIPPIHKSRVVDFSTAKGRTHYQHEDLAGIAKVVDPILSKHGLSYRYRSAQNERMVTVTCIISHRDGFSEETSLSTPMDESGNKNHIQAVGSAATYLQRYTLKLALGLSATTDDDGKGAGPNTATIAEDQFVALRDLMAEAEADEGRFLKHFSLTCLEEMPVARYGEADAMLRAKIKGKSNG